MPRGGRGGRRLAAVPGTRPQRHVGRERPAARVARRRAQGSLDHRGGQGLRRRGHPRRQGVPAGPRRPGTGQTAVSRPGHRQGGMVVRVRRPGRPGPRRVAVDAGGGREVRLHDRAARRLLLHRQGHAQTGLAEAPGERLRRQTAALGRVAIAAPVQGRGHRGAAEWVGRRRGAREGHRPGAMEVRRHRRPVLLVAVCDDRRRRRADHHTEHAESGRHRPGHRQGALDLRVPRPRGGRARAHAAGQGPVLPDGRVRRRFRDHPGRAPGRRLHGQGPAQVRADRVARPSAHPVRGLPVRGLQHEQQGQRARLFQPRRRDQVADQARAVFLQG